MKSEKLPVYTFTEATSFIYQTIPEGLRAKYSPKTIYSIVELVDDFYDIIGLNVYEDTPIDNSEPITVNQDDIAKYILSQAPELGIEVDIDDLNETLLAELQYNQQLV